MNWIITPEEVQEVYNKFLGFETYVALPAEQLLYCWELDKRYNRLKQMLIEANDRKQYNLDFKDYLK